MNFEYSLKQSNYNDYMARNNNYVSHQSEDVKDGKATYYLIFKGNEFIEDFVVYKEDNWLSIRDEALTNHKMVKEIFLILSQVYDKVILYLDSKEIATIDYLVNNFLTINESIPEADMNKIIITLK